MAELEPPAPDAGQDEPVDEPEPEPQPELTPMGNRRSPVTESEDLDYRMPKLGFLKRSNGAQKVDTKGIERTGAMLTQALGHFNVDARRDRDMSAARTSRATSCGSRPASRCRRSRS